MGRATITATPVTARPAAPTISTLQLPFLPQQIAKITYPSGEFTAADDQVIEIGVLNSIGRQVAGTNFLLLKQDQDPPDTDQVFRVPYLARWNLAGETYKGFARVYRQTDEGIRSSPGAADFISSDSAAYAADARDYNGTTMYGARGADLTGNANSKVCIFSIWFRVDAGDGTNRIMFNSTGSSYFFRLTTLNTVRFSVEDTGGTIRADLETTSTFLAGASWYNVIFTLDMANSIGQLAVDGLIESPTVNVAPADHTIDWTVADHGFGATATGSLPWNGCLTEAYMNFAEFLDITDPDNLAAFIDSDGMPVDLGADGAFPTGTQPICYFRVANPAVNRGSGGNYVNNAALSACSDAP
jgi:hypothetical protein